MHVIFKFTYMSVDDIQRNVKSHDSIPYMQMSPFAIAI
jgi:hypothetical protein